MDFIVTDLQHISYLTDLKPTLLDFEGYRLQIYLIILKDINHEYPTTHTRNINT